MVTQMAALVYDMAVALGQQISTSAHNLILAVLALLQINAHEPWPVALVNMSEQLGHRQALLSSTSASRATASRRQARQTAEGRSISNCYTSFRALIVFFSQQVFNPNLSLSEWNLTEMEASLSPVRDVYF